MGNILTTVAVISAITGILALVLTLADRYIADYGEVKMIINEENEYIVEGGSTLLDTLRDQEVFIPSACGGKGTCGYCKVVVHEGGGPVLATEEPHLTEEEIANDTRLSCQLKVKEDIKIEIPPELFDVREFTTTLVEKRPLTDRITLFRFELEEGDTFDFKPGQYVQLKAPEYEGGEDFEGSDEDVYRAYSIASSARDDKHIELIIGYTGGICTTYAHKILEVGDKVDINGPYGDFYYIEDDTEIIMGAGGTGFAPIRSILHHMRDNDIKRPARFYFGARTPDDLFLLDEIEMFERDLADFKFIPTLSRVTEEMNWKGDVGYADKAIRDYTDPQGSYTGYLCGSNRMIESLSQALKDVGLEEENILYDDFS